MTDIDYDKPDWTAGGRVHNWRNYVYDDLRAIWHTFTLEQKRVIRENADIEAGDEHWE